MFQIPTIAVPAMIAAIRVRTRIVPRPRSDLRSRSHRIVVDEPASLGGDDTAANPIEVALASLGSCQAITYRIWAESLGIRLDGVTVELEGDLDVRGFFGVSDDVRPGPLAIRVQVTLRGPETEERYQELAKVVDEHCPVLDLFRNGVPTLREVTVTAA